jgi:hypothetical protein
MMDVIEEHSRKAQYPIAVNESGSVMDVSEEHPLKAPSATLVGTLSRNSRMDSRCAMEQNFFAASEPSEQQSMYVR